MASLVLELQREALNSTVPVTDLLRKALVVARKLGIKEFQAWIEYELNGYANLSDIPKYRLLSGSPKFVTIFGGLNDFTLGKLREKEKLSLLPTDRPIGEIEYLLKESGKKPFINMPYPDQLISEIAKNQSLPSRPFLLINHSSIQGLIDAVRNVVLKWTLKLEEDGILGEAMTFTKEEKQVASSHVYNIQTFIGHMSHSQFQQDTRDSVQTMSINDIDIGKVMLILEEIKKAIKDITLPSETKDELSAEIATVETQAASPKPKMKIIKESLHTIRNILEGTAGSLLASGLLEKLKTLL